MSLSERIAGIKRNAAIKVAKRIDTANANSLRGNRVKFGVHADNSALTRLFWCGHCERETTELVCSGCNRPTDETADYKRTQLHKAGAVHVAVAKSHGTVVSPSAYRIWKAAGCKPHPVFAPEAWRNTRYRGNVAVAVGALEAQPIRVHPQGCACIICREFANRVQRTTPSVASVQPRYAKQQQGVCQTAGFIPPWKRMAIDHA